jgi:hypothetical protein
MNPTNKAKGKETATSAKDGEAKAKQNSVPVMTAVQRRIYEQCMALDRSELRSINVDVPAACSVMQGASDKIKAHVEEILAEIPKFDVAHAEELSDRAEFAHYTYSACMGVADDKTARDALVQGNERRKQMQQWADSCLKLGFATGLDLDAIERLPYGYRDTPYALNALHSFFLERKGELASKVTLPWDEIDSARALAARIATLAGSASADEALEANWELAQRAFTLAAFGYDELRAALDFVRRARGDSAEIAPGFGNRATGKSAKNDKPKDDRDGEDKGGKGGGPVVPRVLRGAGESDGRSEPMVNGLSAAIANESPFANE